MSKNFQKSIDNLKIEIQELSDDIQQLALFALEQAKKGNIQYANQVVDAVVESAMFEPNYIIEWFEVFGKLKWSNKKRRLVISGRGRWLVSKAQEAHWAEIPLGKLSKGSFKESSPQQARHEPLSESNFSSAIRAYLSSHPIETSAFGKFGLPADKNRWGKYKLKIKHK